MSETASNIDGLSAEGGNIPSKRILTKAHLEAFQASQTHRDVTEFIDALNTSIVGVKLGQAGEGSVAVKSVLAMLDEVEELAKSIPPVDNAASRFGNPAFKTFYDQVEQSSLTTHSKYLPDIPVQNKTELCTYFNECWGNRTRIDYGSGMELNFLCWLLCLRKIGIFTKEDNKSLVILIFWRYIQIMRYLQSTYWLEPAGSHGVWGLDDYHFLPFLWGSGQLANHKHLKPKAIHDQEILEEFSKDYMYLQCIQFINSIKTASLRWHSPMLDDITAVKTWAKVNEGMIKMYKAEVLGKLPVIQHFLFGSLLPAPDLSGLEGGDLKEDEHGHIHGKSEPGWTMDCCGIPVPSAFAAAASNTTGAKPTGLLQPRTGLKPIPFD